MRWPARGTLWLLLAGGLGWGCVSASQRRADEALAVGRYSEAIEALEQALEERPGDPELLGAVAQARADWAAELERQAAEAASAGDAFLAWALAHQASEVRGRPGVRVPAYAAAFLEAQAALGWEEALARLLQAQALGMRGPAIEAALQARRGEGARRWSARAEEASERGALEEAVLGAARACALSDEACATGLQRRTEEALLDSLRRPVFFAYDERAEASLRPEIVRWLGERAGVLALVPGETAGALKVRVGLEVEQRHSSVEREVVLERKIGEQTEANPEYVRQRKAAKQLKGEVENARQLMVSQWRQVEALKQEYYRTMSPQVAETLQREMSRLADLQIRYEGVRDAYIKAEEDLAETPQLLKRPVVERATLQGTLTTQTLVGRATLEVAGRPAAEVAYEVVSRDLQHEGDAAREIPPDALELPSLAWQEERLSAGLRGRLERPLEEALFSAGDPPAGALAQLIFAPGELSEAAAAACGAPYGLPASALRALVGRLRAGELPKKGAASVESASPP